MTKSDIKEIVATEYANATRARKRGQQMTINAIVRQRRAVRAIRDLNMETPIEE